ncbi:SAM-dependent methyltransferase [Actinomadura viridis]|uniref:SAM-dependent methyltransferase n=1 Tax=Actinomadura viridis TaxID=58110 RepID=UPI0036AE6B34
MNVPERVRWAVEVLDPGPADRVLEVGCGPGVAAALVCARLTTGRLLAIDRSAVAVRRTTERNAEHLAAGRLEVRRCSLDALEGVPPGSLDAAFSIDVNVFWTRRPVAELDRLAAALRPGGALHVLYGASGPTAGERVTGPVAEALRERGFGEVTVLSGPRGLGVSARRPAGLT